MESYESSNNIKNILKLYIFSTIVIFFLFFKKIKNLEYNIYNLNQKYSLNNEKLKIINNKTDKDLIGMIYPDINYDEIQNDLNGGSLINTFSKFLQQLEDKLIYLEKEINVTKLASFHYIRTSYLNNMKVSYRDENITELHNIINWEVIHKSNQLKGIASDKYLGCKYAKIKLGINLCEQRIKTYENLDEINFEELAKKGNIVLKITNGCHDLVYIRKKNIKNKDDLDIIKNKVKYYFQRDFGLMVPEFFHLYSKKRIIEEIIFEPFVELSEFKFFVVNGDIKFLLLYFFKNNKLYRNFYNSNYQLFNRSELKEFDIFSEYGNDILEKLKYYTYKLSEDFKNFIRVDLYVFKKKIYLSELTFDSYHGCPYLINEDFITNAGKNFTKYE